MSGYGKWSTIKRKKGECGMTIAELQNTLQLEIQAVLVSHYFYDPAKFAGDGLRVDLRTV
jgi:hypothetical protein